ncbi:MAG: hypothetical protein IKI84_04290 [Clostridia bacterium]|nr:hypothetical protein [Clostridia bacterium]
MDTNEMIRYLKHESTQALSEIIKKQEKQAYISSFPVFMDRMIREKHIKRKDIALRTGLSQDYTYKILNGSKRTAERDYILAICFAVRMDMAQTQHALNIYGMPQLDENDARSAAIIRAIEKEIGFDGCNKWLESCGLPLLRTSPDMEKAGIHVIASAPDGKPAVPHRDPHCYEEVSGYTQAEKCGCAPFDYAYRGGIAVRNSEGELLRLESYYSPELSYMVMMTQEHYEQALAACEQMEPARQGNAGPYRDELTDEEPGLSPEQGCCPRLPLNDAVIDERYDSLEEAAGSDLFFWFLEIDDRIDKKIRETLDRVKDTRYWPNAFRAGGGWAGGKAQVYMEAFNDREPGRREYFQILQQDGRTLYSATHASIFMRMELGDSLYNAYFGDEPGPEYWFRVDSLEDLKEDRERLTQIFTILLHLLHRNADPEFMKAVGMNVPELQMLHEENTLLSGRIREAIVQSRYEDALKDIDAREKMLERIKAQGEDIACALVSSLYDRARVTAMLDDPSSALDIYRRIYAMKDCIRDMDPVRFEMGMSAFQLAENAPDIQQRTGYSRSAREWLKDVYIDHCAMVPYMIACGSLAFCIDAEEPEKAVELYKEAISISISRRIDLDRLWGCRAIVVLQYGNLGWVLWNKLGSEEAMIWYVMALEMMDDFLADDHPEIAGQLRSRYSHIATLLDTFYQETGREKDRTALTQRMEKRGIPFENR